MSIFKDSGIILNIQKLKEKSFIFTLYSLKFGKIKVIKKGILKEKNIDLGFHINYEIKVFENLNKISNIKIINEFNCLSRGFNEINSYLFVLKTVLEKVPDGVENKEIFEVLNILNKYHGVDVEIKNILARLKVIDILGELGVEHKNKIVSKILIFIHKNHFNKIIKLIGIDNKIKNELSLI